MKKTNIGQTDKKISYENDKIVNGNGKMISYHECLLVCLTPLRITSPLLVCSTLRDLKLIIQVSL